MTRSALRERVRRVIFEHDRPVERAFDVVLIVAILASVVVVMMESVASVAARWHGALWTAEWVFTILFTAEYLLRLWSAPRASAYARSFYGIIDLLAVLPTYVAVLVPGTQFLLVVRLFRVLRVFRILKLTTYIAEASVLGRAVVASRYKIAVFVFFVLTTVVVVGALMYIIEGPAAGFTSIPRGVYWGIVTLTTVGYGDIAPITPLGQMLASAIMIMGYGVIAVPTGIVTLELQRAEAAADAGRAPARTPTPAAVGTGATRCPHCGGALSAQADAP